MKNRTIKTTNLEVEMFSEFKRFCNLLGGDRIEYKDIVFPEITKLSCYKGSEKLFEGILVDGEYFVNATPHELKFAEKDVKIDGSVFLAKKLSARPVERVVAKIGVDEDIKIVTTEFEPTEEGERLAEIARELGINLVGSIISAQAYGYPPVVSPITTPETSRLPPPQRKVYLYKWNAYIK